MYKVLFVILTHIQNEEKSFLFFFGCFIIRTDAFLFFLMLYTFTHFSIPCIILISMAFLFLFFFSPLRLRN